MSLASLASIHSSLFSGKGSDDTRLLFIVGAICCAMLPLDISHIAFVLVGAVGYALLLPVQAVKLEGKKGQANCAMCTSSEGSAKFRGARREIQQKEPALKKASDVAAAPTPLRTRAPQARTWQALAPPTFSSSDFDAQVEELLSQLMPSPESDAVVKRLANTVKKLLQPLIPEAEVVGFANGDITRGKAFGVAVPDVDILVKADEAALARRLQARLQAQANSVPSDIDANKLQKSSIRACTDRLVMQGGIKFRRSAFKEKEPKVTLLAPASLVFDKAIAFDFSVNTTTPVHHAELVADCERIDPRARALILLVKRWAKDRGICHAPKGHLSPYLWSILAIYFLQVNDEAGPILPALDDFKLSRSSSCIQVDSSPAASVSQLFKQFFDFYANQFEWGKEAISIRLARRAAPDQSLASHLIVHDDGVTTEAGPSIEDPFNVANNLGSCCNAVSFARLKEELARANKICSSHGASLVQMLEEWVPPDYDQ